MKGSIRSVLSLIVLLLTTAFGLSATAGERRPAPHRHVLTLGENGALVCRVVTPDPAEKTAAQAWAQTASSQTVRYASAGSTWEVTYVGFGSSPAAQAAFEHAVNIWAQFIESPVTIRVRAEFSPIGGLGSAGPALFTWPDNPDPDFRNLYYSAALLDALTGADTDPGQPDIEATFNSSFGDWYFGLDGNPPFEKYDFVSVVLHELAHGLGFVSSIGEEVPGGPITWGLDGQNRPTVYDFFITTYDEAGGIDEYVVEDRIANGSAELEQVVTGRGVFFWGVEAIRGDDQRIPELYAPRDWEQGSSIAHLDEYHYAEFSPDGLMTPFLYNGEVQHHPGPITLGIFRDMGWRIYETTQFAQFANGAGIQSDVVLTNSSPDQTVRGEVLFYNLDGVEVPPGDVLNTGNTTFEIPPLGTRTFSTKGGATLIQGSAVVKSDRPISGVIRFDLPGSGVAGVGSSEPAKSVVVPVRRKGALSTGVAVRNVSLVPISVNAVLLGSNGAVVQQVTLQLEPQARIARFIHEEDLFENSVGNDDFEGVLRLTATGGEIAVIGLELEVGSRFTTLPVRRVE